MNELDQIRKRMANRKQNQFVKTNEHHYYEKEDFIKDNNFAVFYHRTIKIMFLIIFVLSIAIFNRLNQNNDILTTVFKTDMNFAAVRNFIVNSVGNILPFDYIDKTDKLVSGSNQYTIVGENLYINNDNTAVAINSGIVLFVGSDEFNTKKVVVQLDNGVKATYELLQEVNVGIYDRVSKGDILGYYEKELSIIFEKDGNKLTYEQAQSITY